MDKVKMQSMDITADNIEKIGALFPEAVTEVKKDGKVTKAIDFDVLKNLLIAGNTEIAEGRKERYEFNWPEKKKHARLANQPITSTLRPMREDSVDFDTTENLYIEGDNLEVLKLLQNGYAGRIKMIYIDPPYNTGNDFVYNDDFKASEQNFKEANSYYDEDGNVIADANTTSNGRFHTDWLNMMYPRLKLAKNLLSDDGVIFISIDDNEVENLRKICDEIFGINNFISQMVWKNKYGAGGGTSKIANIHEYILIYSKNELDSIYCELSEELQAQYKNKDEYFSIRGGYVTQPMATTSKGERVNLMYEIVHNGEIIKPPKGGRWIWSKEKFDKAYAENKIVINKIKNGYSVRFKQYLRDDDGNLRKGTQMSLISNIYNQEGSKEFSEIMDDKRIFGFPKPINLLKQFFKWEINNNNNGDMIVLDFFSGSATTAHAVMQLNAEDNGNRKFIMVQLPEKTDEKSEAHKAGYKNICEIGKERIRRAGKKIKDENPLTTTDLDTGFRVLRLDSSNMKEVFYKPEEFTQENIALFADNVKADRTDEDLLFQTMLSHKIELSVKIEELTLAGKKAFSVDDGYLIACFDKDITIDTIEAIAKRKPVYAVVRDDSFNGDSTAENFEQIFRQFSPDTVRKVI